MIRSRNTDSRPEQQAAILKAAAEEVALVGVGRANMDVIARQAGVSRSTLYRRYPSRDALISELGRQTSISPWPACKWSMWPRAPKRLRWLPSARDCVY